MQRDNRGRFTHEHADPEVTLGDRVIYRGGVHRVTRVMGASLMLANVAGGRVVAIRDSVDVAAETPGQRLANTRLEALVAGVRATVRGATRQQLDRMSDTTAVARAARQSAQRAARDGKLDNNSWRMAAAIAAHLPAAAQDAVVAEVAMNELSPGEYQALRRGFEEVAGPLRMPRT